MNREQTVLAAELVQRLDTLEQMHKSLKDKDFGYQSKSEFMTITVEGAQISFTPTIGLRILEVEIKNHKDSLTTLGVEV
jgi:hypothetical protein